MKFRKQPVVIEAEQFILGQPLPRGVELDIEGVERGINDATRYFVVTIHRQRVYLVPGDWIVPEPDGQHFYPIKPEVMATNYDPLPDGADELSMVTVMGVRVDDILAAADAGTAKETWPAWFKEEWKTGRAGLKANAVVFTGRDGSVRTVPRGTLIIHDGEHGLLSIPESQRR